MGLAHPPARPRVRLPVPPRAAHLPPARLALARDPRPARPPGLPQDLARAPRQVPARVPVRGPAQARTSAGRRLTKTELI